MRTDHTYRHSDTVVRVHEGRSFSSLCDAECPNTCERYRWYYPDGTYDGQILDLHGVDHSMDYILGKYVYCVAWDTCFGPHGSFDTKLDIGCKHDLIKFSHFVYLYFAFHANVKGIW